jgi:hypothetical protein
LFKTLLTLLEIQPKASYGPSRCLGVMTPACGCMLERSDCQASQPDRTSGTANPESSAQGSGHEQQPSTGSNHGPAAARRCCRQLARIAKLETANEISSLVV